MIQILSRTSSTLEGTIDLSGKSNFGEPVYLDCVSDSLPEYYAKFGFVKTLPTS